VSGGELQRVLAAGGESAPLPSSPVWARRRWKSSLHCGRGVYSFNAESEPELLRIKPRAARLKKIAPVAVRLNPNVEAHTHAKITTGTYENKFGIAFERLKASMPARAN